MFICIFYIRNADTLFTVKWKNFKWKPPDNWPNCRATKQSARTKELDNENE